MKTGNAASTRAVIYVRQSRTHDGSISQELQEASCREYAQRKGYEVVATEADIDFSGLDMKKRKGLARAMDLFTDRKADLLIVWRWSRLSRKTYDQAYLINEIEKAGGRVESAMEPTEPGAAGEFSRDMLLAMAAFESKQKSETWKQTHDRRLAKGLPASGTKYFGYIKYPDRYEVHEEMAQHIREAYRMFIDGKGTHLIAKMLNSSGAHEQITVKEDGEHIMEKRGEWNATKVLQVLRYDFYRGKIMHEGKEYPGAHQAVISDATWHAFQKATKREAMIPSAEKGNDYWLSRLVKCGHCGGAMSRAENKSGKYLRCRGKANGTSCPGVRCRQDHVEWAVWVWLLDHLDDLANQLPSDDDAKHAADEAVVTTRAAMEAASKAITDLQLMAVRMSWNDSQVRGAMDELQPELERATAEYEEALARQGSFTPAADVMERWKRGMELRNKLAMEQPVYDDDGNIIGPAQEADPEFQAKVTAEFAADLRAIIKSITVSPDFPDKTGRLRKGETRPVQLERYTIEPV